MVLHVPVERLEHRVPVGLLLWRLCHVAPCSACFVVNIFRDAIPNRRSLFAELRRRTRLLT